MFEIPSDLNPALVGLAWLVGISGVLVVTALVSFPLLAFGASRLGRVGEA